ncbi:hypothetical protein ACROYT_G012831, partial [Oculina patagonica]
MALEINTAQESTSSKKSIILKAKHQGDAKVVLVKHYLPSSNEKGKETEKTFTKDHAASKAYKRKSLEIACTKDTNEQCPSGKRRRSVQLTGATKPTVSLLQDLAQNTNTGTGIDGNVCHMQNARLGNETLDFVENDGQHNKLVDNFQDCILLPNWSDKRNRECLDDSNKMRLDEHKSLLSATDLDSPHVTNNRKCKSIFETYQ